jgi:hypothetical protein
MVKKMNKHGRVHAMIYKLGLFLLMTANPVYGWDGLAVLGDSLSTGAGAHPDLKYDSMNLWRVVKGESVLKTDVAAIPEPKKFNLGVTLDAPKRLWPGARENDGGVNWIWSNSLQALSRVVLDTEEYSYGYLFGRALGFSPQNIWIAGDNGSKTEHAAVHAARVLESSGGDLPSHILMLYTGNDLCAPSWELMTDPKTYGEGLRRGIMFLAMNGKNSSTAPVNIYLPAFLPVVTLMSEPEILDKMINFYGSEISCREARKRLFSAPDSIDTKDQSIDPLFPLFSQMMPPNPALLCPTLFSVQADNSEKLSVLANRVRAYREVQQEIAAQINKEIAENSHLARINVVYLPSVERLKFSGSDVSGDCFHLSPAGHAKVALTMHSDNPKEN